MASTSSDRLLPINDDVELRILRAALLSYRKTSQHRHDPKFRPAPGQVDRNLLAVEVCSRFLERLPANDDSHEPAAGEATVTKRERYAPA